MVKRKHVSNISNNPLSDARRQQGKKNNKLEQQVQSLWHRKSGAGYALFVSYYGSQPVGVVVEDSAQKCLMLLSKNHPCEEEKRKSGLCTTQGAGLSRAARKRRKKKKHAMTPSDPPESIKITDEAPVQCDNDTSVSSPLAAKFSGMQSKLLQAFETRQSEFAHLAPFLVSLSKPLPLTFRLRSWEEDGSSSISRNKDIRNEILDHSDLVCPVKYDPTRMIYQSIKADLSKASLSRISPSLKEVLVENSANGTLARQELGSMLPVLALHGGGWLQSGSKVLDLCASPGSKTLQAIEIIASSDGGKKRGRVIANDVHEGRLESLKDAVERSGIPEKLASRVTYTNFDASIFPSPKSGKLFDAIIADVPCSGDGTIRKDKHILPMWTPDTGNALHKLQVKILKRALELVKVGGVVCYSTCSLNPVEDEAVVASVLDQINSTRKEKMDTTEQNPVAELVDWPSQLLPKFVRRPGVKTWKIAGYTGEESEGNDFGDLTWFQTFEEASSAEMAHAEKTMWPLPIDSQDKYHLERCSRLWPHDQDTGGFFVALIQKNQSLAPER